MPRRKRTLDDGDDSDSSYASDNFTYHNDDDPDLREERELFEDPYKRKRRRKNGKEDAIYGVFADESDEEDYRRPSRKTNWTKAPAFVSSDKKSGPQDEDAVVMDVSEEKVGDEEEEEEEGEESEGEDAVEEEDNISDSEPSRQPSPRVRLEDEEEDYVDEQQPKQRRGGLGFKPAVTSEPDVADDMNGAFAPSGGIGARAGIGARGGIGARSGIGARGGIGSANAEERIPTPSFSKGGIGAVKSLAASFSSAVPLSTVSSVSPSPAPSRPQTDSAQASSRESSAAPSSTLADSIPTAFGRSQSQRAQSQRFKRDATPSTKPVPLNPSERAHFSKISGTFGARMLEKMGWQAGTGLGVTGEGIVTPIESKLRPQKMGIAFRGFKEKTEQSKMEARRRGEVVSEDEDEKIRKMKKKAKEAEKKREDVWKRPKKVKAKIEHKTYEQIIAEAGQEPPAAGIGQIIDATGAVPREVSSLSEVNLNTWAPTSDPTRIPEIRHNIRLIAEACKTDLEGLAREARALSERKKFVISEDARLRKKIEDEAELIARLQQVQLVANDISTLSKELSSTYEVDLESFTPLVHKLVEEYGKEFERYGLDEVIVAAIAPLVRRMITMWNPLEEPKAFVSTFRGWKRALRVNHVVEDPEKDMQVDMYGARSLSVSAPEVTTPMTPFESLLWNVWLPKVRSTLNNEWTAENPNSAVRLYESWATFLPPFIRDNMLDQLILPKVHKAVSEWNPRRANTSLKNIVFPWLPFVGLRLDGLMDDARRKIKSLLRSWAMGDDIPEDLADWRDVYDKGEWDTIMLKYIVPKLSGAMRTSFRIDPRNQSMETFNQTLLWSSFIRPSIFAQIYESEFFAEWLKILHFWLIQPRVSFEEVAQWYQFWKGSFPAELRDYGGIGRGFTRGLQLMNQAIELGEDAPRRLPKPDWKAEVASVALAAKPTAGEGKAAKGAGARPAARVHEITFRSIVEEFAAARNLLFMPTNKAHAHSRMPLFRVSPSADGKKGLLVYILDDAVWASTNGGSGNEMDEFRAISLDDMVLRAIAVS